MNKRIASIAAVLCAAALLAGGIAGAKRRNRAPARPLNPSPSLFGSVKKDIEGTAPSRVPRGNRPPGL